MSCHPTPYLYIHIKMKKYIAIFFLSVVCFSCIIKKPKQFIYPYDGENTGLDSLINIDGYYSKLGYADKILLFYRDGIFISNNFRDTAFASKKIVKVDTLKNSYEHSWYKGLHGRYIIKDDSILAQDIVYTFTDGSNAYTNKYKIISKDTIFDTLEKKTYVFHSLPNRIDSANWLFKKKWFYKDKELYNKMKKARKNKPSN